MLGTSGVRGHYGTEITPELIMRIANAFAEEGIAIGRDTRESGPALEEAAVSGIVSAGKDARMLGIAPTPAVAFETMKGGRGLMVTASHNPPDHNGLKLLRNGREMANKDAERMLARFETGLEAAAVPGSSFEYDIYPEYIEFLYSLVDAAAVERKKPKVVVDANGAACRATPELLGKMGCRVYSLNCEGHGLNRPSEPSAGNLGWVRSAVKALGADFGVAHDGDGDRCVIIDEKGEVLNPDVQLALMIEEELGAGKGKIVSTVESSLIIKEAAEEAGGEFVLTPVGSTHVGEALEREGAVFGGEPAGEYVFARGVHVPDGVLTAAKFAEMFARSGNFSSLAGRFRPNPMVREKFPTKDREKAMGKIASEMSLGGEVSSMDGLRVDGEGWWVLVRPSGTEKIIRLTAEAETRELLEKVAGKAREAVRNSV